jgi:uncharacterized protein (TIGR00661 family)
MKYFFIVQGEGMGHTTQSLALRSMLERQGHTVVNTLLGKNFLRAKNILYRKIQHQNYFSPVFLRKRDKTGINLFTTFLYNFILSPLYLFSILQIAFRIRASNAGVIVVFYDFVGQAGSFLSFSGKPVFTISHHYFFEHESFEFPAVRKLERLMLKIHSSLASIGAHKKLAISFTHEPDIPGKKIYVVPPLLRAEIINAEPVVGRHVHIYCLQPGFINSIIQLAQRTPEKDFIVFIHEFQKETILPENLKISGISGKEFLESIRTAGLVICTAGFETLAEAVFLDKSLIIVPSKNHFEQYCNSVDAIRANAATAEENFNIINTPDFTGNPAHSRFMKWIARAEEIFIKHLTE